MKKIPSLFKRDYKGTRLVYDEVVPGSEWVIMGEGVATEKFDGTACAIRGGQLFKRYDRKLKKGPYKRKRREPDFAPTLEDYKPAPPGWEACEEQPNHHTGHWPGWIPVSDEPESKWHRRGLENMGHLPDGTYELVGPRVGGNPHNLERHELWRHASVELMDAPRNFTALQQWFRSAEVEGVVWHHPDGRMVKIKRRDFGYTWPLKI